MGTSLILLEEQEKQQGVMDKLECQHIISLEDFEFCWIYTDLA